MLPVTGLLVYTTLCDVHYKQRAVIQFSVKSGEKASKILRKLQVVYGDDSMSKTSVFECAKRFKEGRESVEDDPREGTPVTFLMLITSDRRLSIRALSYELNINKIKTVRKMFHENLNIGKICAKMVLKVLTQEQKHMRKLIWKDLNDLAFRVTAETG
ncbi:protein GVQW3-like [Eupeodes corollae]|uniref:protein GVQW3-like n=1 Tax=Eupeodes corollae TaxID=290404 RepID=UPI00248FB941|nr:protein GVQW3-like [Eupeodes corollae]